MRIAECEICLLPTGALSFIIVVIIILCKVKFFAYIACSWVWSVCNSNRAVTCMRKDQVYGICWNEKEKSLLFIQIWLWLSFWLWHSTMSDSALVLLNGVARGFRDSITGMVRVYQMDSQQTDEVDSGEGSASEETPTILARRRAARKKRAAGSSTKDRFVPRTILYVQRLCYSLLGVN